MGMTIDDCIKMLIAKEKCMERETRGIETDCYLHNCDDCSLCYEQGTMGEQKKALLFAIDTMRKYQKIEQIYNDRLGKPIGHSLNEIWDVLESEDNEYTNASENPGQYDTFTKEQTDGENYD